MKDEPEIVKMLKDEEKLGKLQSKTQSICEELKESEMLLEEDTKHINDFIEGDVKTKNIELKDFENVYQTVFENSAVAITLADENERIISWNKYAEELFNMNEKDLYLRYVSSFYPPEEWKKIRAENIRQKGIKYKMETKMIKKNKGIFDVEISLCILRGVEGKTVGSVCIIKDVTQLKKTEKELKESEERYRTIFENSAVAITLTDENERIVSWNKYAENLLGMGKEDLFMKPVKSFYPPEEWKKIRSENVRQKGMQHRLETKILRKNNEPLDVDISLSVLKNNAGKVIGSIGVIKDITDRKQAEQKLTSLMEYAYDSIYLVDEDCRYILVNNELLSRLDLPKDQVIGKTFSELHSSEETQEFTEKINWVFENAKPIKDEHRIERLDRWFLRTLSPVKDDITGQITAVAVISKDITDWKTAEEKLKASEERYRTIFDNSAVAITLTDENERIVSWNKYAEELFGMSKEELFMKPVKSLYPSEEWKKIRSQNVRQKGMKHSLETKIIKKNNEQIDVDISLSVLKDHEENVIGSIGVIQNISEKKQAEERLNSLMDNAYDSIYLVDMDCRYLLVNNDLSSRLGLPKNQVIGKRFGELHSPGETKDFIERIKWVFTHGKPIKDEHRNEKLGQWFLRTLSPVRDDITDQIISVAVISKDITDWKTAEEKLKKSEERYRTIFDNSAVAIMLSDENERIISWNKYTEKLLGMSKEDLYLKSVKSFYSPEEWRKIRAENIRQKGMKHHLETKIIRKNNEQLNVDISLSVLKNNEDKIIGSIGIIKDITEQKQAEEELKKNAENLGRMNKELNAAREQLSILNRDLELKVKKRTAEVENLLKQKDEFIGQLGHDLKTPLSILLNILPMLKEESEGKDSEEYCEVVGRNVNYIRNLVTETLKIAELSSPNVRFNLVKLKLRDIASETIRDKQLVFKEKNIVFENNINEGITIVGDKLRLDELFNNLISNSLKYTPDSGSTISINSKKGKDFVTVSVRDNGIGMTKGQLKHIFDEFYKADQSRHNLDSSGLGLSICKRIVEKHGGRIWAESQGEDKGTTFYFTLKFDG